MTNICSFCFHCVACSLTFVCTHYPYYFKTLKSACTDHWTPQSHFQWWSLNYGSQCLPATRRRLGSGTQSASAFLCAARWDPRALSFISFQLLRWESVSQHFRHPSHRQTLMLQSNLKFQESYLLQEIEKYAVLPFCLFKENTANYITTASYHIDAFCSQMIIFGSTISLMTLK